MSVDDCSEVSVCLSLYSFASCNCAAKKQQFTCRMRGDALEEMPASRRVLYDLPWIEQIIWVKERFEASHPFERGAVFFSHERALDQPDAMFP